MYARRKRKSPLCWWQSWHHKGTSRIVAWANASLADGARCSRTCHEQKYWWLRSSFCWCLHRPRSNEIRTKTRWQVHHCCQWWSLGISQQRGHRKNCLAVLPKKQSRISWKCHSQSSCSKMARKRHRHRRYYMRYNFSRSRSLNSIDLKCRFLQGLNK